MQFQRFDWLSGHGRLCHARELAAIKLSSGCSFKAKSPRSCIISCFLLNKTIIPVVLVGYMCISYPTRAGGSLVKTFWSLLAVFSLSVILRSTLIIGHFTAVC